MAKTSVVLGIVVAVIVVAVAAVFLLPSLQQAGPAQQTPTRTQAPPPPTTPTGPLEIIVYGGEVEATKYGYGFSEDSIKSPGPDIRVKVGTQVKLVFKNAGNLPHTLAITEEKKFDAEPLWGVQLGTPTKPVGPGNEKSITFTPNKAGEYYYLCQVPGHIELGMWGKLIAED